MDFNDEKEEQPGDILLTHNTTLINSTCWKHPFRAHSGINCLHMSPGNDNRMQRAGSRHDRHHIPDDNEDNGKLLHAVMRPDDLGYTHIQ